LAKPSELGGFPEFLDDITNRASSSPIRPSSSPIRATANLKAARNSAFSATNSSYDGRAATPNSDTTKIQTDSTPQRKPGQNTPPTQRPTDT
jgi:hypothetical protein